MQQEGGQIHFSMSKQKSFFPKQIPFLKTTEAELSFQTIKASFLQIFIPDTKTTK